MSGLRVAVLMGGRSSEHEISVASARSVVEGLREAGYHPVPIEISREGRWALPTASPAEVGAGYIRPLRGGEADIAGGPPIPRAGAEVAPFGAVDVVFPVLHGPFGEDGTVQGLLELADVAYVGPGVAASAVAMDKDLFKAVMRANDIPVTTKRHRARASARPNRAPVRAPRRDQARQARLERRDHAGTHTRRSSREESIWPSSTTRRC